MKKKIFTIPNLLSLFRLLLIPLIVWLFSVKENTLLAIAVILLSGLTDIVDGYVARHFNMVSDIGKILDPIADKLTQAAVLICIALRFIPVRFLFALMAVKEILMGVFGLIVIRRTSIVSGAHWHGKFCTVTLYCVILVHMFFFSSLPQTVSAVLCAVCALVMLASLLLYLREDLHLLQQNFDESSKA